MENEIDADYRQQFLLPLSIENWIPQVDSFRFIRELVSKLDLSELGFKERSNQEGRPNYSDKLLFNIWLYGYFEKIYSSRELEKACKDWMALIWFSGMNYPDHNPIWRFFKRNKNCIKNVFKKTVHIAIENNLVGFALQSIYMVRRYMLMHLKKMLFTKKILKSCCQNWISL